MKRNKWGVEESENSDEDQTGQSSYENDSCSESSQEEQMKNKKEEKKCE